MDCMIFMKNCPDNAFDLAIVDPPYGIDDKLCNGGGFMRDSPSRKKYAEKRWDKKPNNEYFSQLMRTSKNQIICGGNYFSEFIPASRGIIAWIKPEMKNHPNFSQFEMIWTSFDKSAKCFNYYSTKSNRIHPTQKPVALYKWLLTNYAKPGDKLLDTHSGSGSFRIAAHDLDFDLVSCELDPDYCRDNEARYQKHIQQIDLFKPKEIQEKIFAERELF